MRGQFVKERVGLRSLWVWDWGSPDLSVGGQSILEPAEITNPNAESVGRGLNMMEQYQAKADTFWILIRRLETRNYSVQESHAPQQLQPWHGCRSKCYSLS